MQILWTIFRLLESQVINRRPRCEALLLEYFPEVRFTTADTFEYLECFIKLYTILMSHLFDLLDESFEFSLLIALLGGCSLVGCAGALAVLLQESLLD